MNYEITDIYLTGYLLANGMKMKSFSKTSGITAFQFEQTDKLLQLVETYYALNASVNPQAYGNALKNLKNIIYQDKHNNGQYMFNQQRKAN